MKWKQSRDEKKTKMIWTEEFFFAFEEKMGKLPYVFQRFCDDRRCDSMNSYVQRRERGRSDEFIDTIPGKRDRPSILSLVNTKIWWNKILTNYLNIPKWINLIECFFDVIISFDDVIRVCALCPFMCLNEHTHHIVRPSSSHPNRMLNIP